MAPMSHRTIVNGACVLRMPPPWALDRRATLRWMPTVDAPAARGRSSRRTSPHHAATRFPPGIRVGSVVGHPSRATLVPWLVAQARPVRYATRGRSGRSVQAPPGRRRDARPELHQARPDHLLGRGPVPGRAGRRVQEVPRPGARRAVRRRPAHRSSRTSAARIDEVFEYVRPRRHSPRHRSPRSTRPGSAPARTSSSRCSDPPSPTLVHKDLASDGVDRSAPGRPHPGRRAGQPAGAGRAVRRDDRRGTRLPARSRQHARRRRVLARPRPGRLRRAPTPPRRS